jgi:serine/threonine protein kinase
MDSKIFLGKYRVAAEEMEAVGEIAGSPLAYQAEEIDSGKKVVVEVVPAGSLKPEVRERLEAEAVAAKKLSHANIPALCDFGVEENHLVYVTEHFDGTLAEEWVNAHGPMPVGPVLRIASQVVSALVAAAFHRINHRALNPGNLVLVPGQTAEGEWPLIKVLHFVGVAPKLSGTDVAVAAFDKSLHYASPEQIQDGTVDFRSELYSLGSTMWFLLTGAPPLVALAEPMAAAPVETRVAAEKSDAMPKKLRRLLAEMLAANPEARPADPIAFDRTLQDCLHQVERRETVARKFGIPSFLPAGGLRGRPIPVKALALAALFLAIATVGALVVSRSLRHERIVRAEEPIGKPVGVPDASASVTPVTANTNAIASNTTAATTAMAESNNVRPAPPANAEPAPTDAPLSSTESVASASNTQVDVTPAPPPVSDSLKNPPPPEHAPVMANNAASSTSPESASSKQPEPTPAESPVVVTQQSASEKTVMHEVRPAEPAPPEDGPERAVSDPTPSASQPKVAEKSPAKKTERPAKPKRQAERKSERSTAGSKRGRFIGVTPEGWWMLELPSNEIIVVPPESSSR